MNIKQLILVILIGIQLKANAQQKVSLVLNDADFNDVMIGESSPNTNFSPYQLAIGTRLMGKSELRRTLMKFDLSSFAPGSILDSAVLILYEDNESIIIGSYEQSFEIFRNTSPWNGSLVTWNTKPSRIDSGFIENTGLKFNSSNLTELISFFINNPDSNFGFQICIPNEGVDTPYKKIVFLSSSRNKIALRPTLELYFRDNLRLIEPSIADSIFPLNRTAIKWITPTDITNLNISYTTNGTTWFKIVDSIQAILGEYIWKIPSGIDSFMLKLSNPNAPYQTTISPFYFKVVPCKTLHLKPNATLGKDVLLTPGASGLGKDIDFIMAYTKGPPFGWSNMSLLEFDLNAIASTANILDASLYLYATQKMAQFKILINKIEWTESVLNSMSTTYGNQPNSSFVTARYLENGTSVLNQKVTHLIREMVVGTDDHGFVLLPDAVPVQFDSEENTQFASSDNADSTKWPELVINYIGLSILDNIILMDGFLKDSFAFVYWNMDSIYKTDSFTVEKSIDGEAYVPVKTIKATSEKRYTFTDPEIITQKTYYRIKILSEFNKFKYSPVVVIKSSINSFVNKINHPANNDIKLYPNPTNGNIFVLCDKNYTTTLELRNAYGKLIYSYDIITDKTELQLPIEPVSNGLYFITNLKTGKTQKIVLLR